MLDETSATDSNNPNLTAPHTLATDALLTNLNSSANGLSHAEAATRLQRFGCNALPTVKPSSIGWSSARAAQMGLDNRCQEL